MYSTSNLTLQVQRLIRYGWQKNHNTNYTEESDGRSRGMSLALERPETPLDNQVDVRKPFNAEDSTDPAENSAPVALQHTSH